MASTLFRTITGGGTSSTFRLVMWVLAMAYMAGVGLVISSGGDVASITDDPALPLRTVGDFVGSISVGA